MKHFKKVNRRNSDEWLHPKKDSDEGVLSIFLGDEKVTFMEACDNYFNFDLPPSEAVEMLEELTAIIRSKYNLNEAEK